MVKIIHAGACMAVMFAPIANASDTGASMDKVGDTSARQAPERSERVEAPVQPKADKRRAGVQEAGGDATRSRDVADKAAEYDKRPSRPHVCNVDDWF